MKEPEPHCDCQPCRERTVERLRNADHSDVRRWIAALREHLNAGKEKPTDEPR